MFKNSFSRSGWSFIKKCLVYYLCATSIMPLGFAAGIQSATTNTGIVLDSGAYARDLTMPNSNAQAVESVEGPGLGVGNSNANSRPYSDQTKDQTFGLPKGSEYISGYYRGAVLVPVNIIGAVVKEGIHNVPTRTDLLKAVSLAGGLQSDAKLESVTIKRVSGDANQEKIKEEVIKVDMEKLIENPGSRGPILQENDLVYIPRNQPLINNNTLLAIGFISSLLSIVVSGVLISQQLKR